MSDKSSYTPISCAEYDGYEIAIIQQQKLRIAWVDNAHLQHIDIVRPTDLKTAHREEFLLADDLHGKPLQIRLDRIQHCKPVK